MTQEKWESFSQITKDALDLCALLRADFLMAWHRVKHCDFKLARDEINDFFAASTREAAAEGGYAVFIEPFVAACMPSSKTLLTTTR